MFTVMKPFQKGFTGLLALIVLAAGLLVGCGGGGGGGESNPAVAGPLSGRWTGQATRASDSLEILWNYDSGTSAITGGAVLTRDGVTHIGSLTGSVTQASVDNVSFSILFADLGTFDFTATVTDPSLSTLTQITGMYSIGSGSDQTFTIVRRGDATHQNVSGRFAGGWTSQGFPTGGDLEIDFTSQDGNFVSGTFSATGFDSSVSGTFDGVILTDSIRMTYVDGDNRYTFTMSLTPTQISGTFGVKQGSVTDNGTYQLDLQNDSLQ
jgi:hypothetical protein